MAIGSGQHIADPFLAFLRRIFWPNRLPTTSEGKASAVWTLYHAIQTNPGGIGFPMQVVTLSMQGGKPKAAELSREEIDTEHIQGIEDAEKKMSAIFQPQEAPKPPAPPLQGQP